MTTESKPMSEDERLELAATDYADHMATGGRWTASYHDTKTTFKAGYEACAKSKDAAPTDLQKQVNELKYEQECARSKDHVLATHHLNWQKLVEAHDLISKLQQQIADYEKALELVMKNLRYYPDNKNPQGDAEIDAAYNNAEAVLAKYRSETNG